jgi:hypothetical protein
MRLRAVLFDYDAASTDTPRLNHAAWKHVFAGVGVEVGEREYCLFKGHLPKKVSSALCAVPGLDGVHLPPVSQATEAPMLTLGEARIFRKISELFAGQKITLIALGPEKGASRSVV